MNVERASKEVVTGAATAVSRDRPCSKTLEWAVTRVWGRAAAQALCKGYCEVCGPRTE